MFEIIMLVLAVFLSVIGLCELMHRFWMALIRPKGSENMLLTCLCDDIAVERVSAALEELRWQGKNCAVVLIGVDMGLTAELSDTCKRLAEENKDFIFTNLKELEDIIKQRS